MQVMSRPTAGRSLKTSPWKGEERHKHGSESKEEHLHGNGKPVTNVLGYRGAPGVS